MITSNGRSAEAIYQQLTVWKRKAVLEIYQGASLVWTAIKSCFGKGYWSNEHPWLNTDGWKNDV